MIMNITLQRQYKIFSPLIILFVGLFTLSFVLNNKSEVPLYAQPYVILFPIIATIVMVIGAIVFYPKPKEKSVKHE